MQGKGKGKGKKGKGGAKMFKGGVYEVRQREVEGARETLEVQAADVLHSQFVRNVPCRAKTSSGRLRQF